MLYIPTELMILSFIGLVCVLVACLISYVIPFDDEKGHTCVMTALLTALCMVLFYLFVNLILEVIFSIC